MADPWGEVMPESRSLDLSPTVPCILGQQHMPGAPWAGGFLGPWSCSPGTRTRCYRWPTPGAANDCQGQRIDLEEP